MKLKALPEKGASSLMKIPLTMAIIDGITLKTGNNFYSIPVVDILEFFKAKDEMLTQMEDGREVGEFIRGGYYPSYPVIRGF